jgi:dipeptidyl aminopeptidase/acylaminoacyl peptidase
VLVPGSAPLKRGFYSLWAEQLAKRGVVVVVPDKRGVGGTGGTVERNNNTSKANLELLASDAVSALEFAAKLSTVDSTRLGLFGLSQGGWVAPMAAVRSNRARFLLFITSPTVSVREEGAWSRMRGDDKESARYSRADAERMMDTVSVGGVDARSRLGALDIPGLWLFGAEDNSIPTRKSVAVLDSLRRLGKPFQSATFPDAGHVLFTKKGGLIPHIAPSSWDTIGRWLARRINAG